METDPRSEMFCFFDKSANGQSPKKDKKIVLVNVRYALICLFCTHDDLTMQTFIWWCMVWFKAMWFGSLCMNLR